MSNEFGVPLNDCAASEKTLASVRATNRANKVANELAASLIPVFTGLLGTKVQKAGGEFTEKVRKMLPVFPYAPSLRITARNYSKSIHFDVSACESRNDESGACLYRTASVYIGRADDTGILESVQPLEGCATRKTDYNAAEIIEGRAAYRAAKTLADKLLDDLSPFGEYDRD